MDFARTEIHVEKRAWKSKYAVALKRSMAAGYSGVENPLYFKDNTDMLFGYAKDTLSAVFSNLG